MPEDQKNNGQRTSGVAEIISAARSNRADNLRAKAELVKARAEAKAMKRSAKQGRDTPLSATPETGERRPIGEYIRERSRMEEKLRGGTNRERSATEEKLRENNKQIQLQEAKDKAKSSYRENI